MTYPNSMQAEQALDRERLKEALPDYDPTRTLHELPPQYRDRDPYRPYPRTAYRREWEAIAGFAIILLLVALFLIGVWHE